VPYTNVSAGVAKVDLPPVCGRGSNMSGAPHSSWSGGVKFVCIFNLYALPATYFVSVLVPLQPIGNLPAQCGAITSEVRMRATTPATLCIAEQYSILELAS
jgi:hypothetical protein